MEDNNGSSLDAELTADEECACCGESCEICLSVCQSCGMPMNGPQDHGGGDPENACCLHCCHPNGSLKSYEEALEGMTEFMMRLRKMEREAAVQAARDYMATMPAWSGR